MKFYDHRKQERAGATLAIRGNTFVKWLAIVILIAGLMLILVPQIDFQTGVDFQSVMEAVGATLIGAAVTFLVFEQAVIRLTEERVTAAVIDAKIESDAWSDEHAKTMASTILSKRFGDPHLADMVSETLVRWSDVYLRPYWGLNVDLKASVIDKDYYSYEVQRSYRVARSALQKHFVIRCLRSTGSYSRGLLRNRSADYTWAFAAHSDEAKIAVSQFTVSLFCLDDQKLDIPEPEIVELDSRDYIEYRFNIENYLTEKKPEDILRIQFNFSVLQARRFGFFGISAYQPTLNFSSRFDFSALPINAVFLMEYFNDDEKVDVSEPQKGVMLVEATDWVLPGNAAIFSWSDPESN